jgi:hypothetical protein
MTSKELFAKRASLEQELSQVEHEIETYYVSGALIIIDKEPGILIRDDDNNLNLIIGKQCDILETADTLEELIKMAPDFEIVDSNFMTKTIADTQIKI